jgi:hypothetical protein
VKITADTGWREVAVSAALHGSALLLATVLASGAGPGPRLPGSPGEQGGPSGAGGPRVFPVALLAAVGGSRTDVSSTENAAPSVAAAEASLTSPASALEAVPTAGRETPPAVASETVPVEGAEIVEESEKSRLFVTGAPGSSVASAREGEQAAAGLTGSVAGLATDPGVGGFSGGGGAPGPGGSDIVPPTPLHIAVPAIPQGLDAARVKGARTRLLIYVNEEGEVSEVNLLSAARRMRYSPGSQAGSPAAMWTQAEISF